MTQISHAKAVPSISLENRLRQTVEQLTYLPASVSVAIKFIELGKDPDAGPRDYEKTISSDPALGTKILALANSSWYGVRNEVTKIVQAITLLGLANIRTLATSYCMAGLQNQIKIPKEDAKRYWQASLCKGVTAKAFAAALDESLADEAFLAGLFQDVALPLIHSVAQDPLLSILHESESNTEAQIAREREAFSVDHSEVGRWLATKLELPEGYIDAIGFHHDAECLSKFIASDALANAVLVASMFPHLPDRWRSADVDALRGFLSENGPGQFNNPEKFLEAVQKEFDALYAYFEAGKRPELRLESLLADASEQIADSTTNMVGQIHDLMDEAAETGTFVQDLMNQHERVVDESRLDALTGALNRAGFLADAAKIVGLAGRHAIPFMMLYCDVDDFKQINDTHGHHFGDFVLRELCSRMHECLRKTDRIGRLGGDEFVILVSEIQQERAQAIIRAIAHSIRDQQFIKGKVAATATISIGALWVPGSRASYDLTALLAEADTLMYRAKRSGAGEIRTQIWKGPAATEPV